MDPLNIHHVIRHRLSRIETNNFQDKSGCSINGFRSFLFDEGIVQNLDDMESLACNHDLKQDYRGYPINLWIDDFNNFPLSNKILRMKNLQFNFQYQSKPIHKLVSPEPHFIEEERNLIENNFNYLGYSYFKVDDIEDSNCFEMDNEGHLVSLSMNSFQKSMQLTNESIEHLSNFPNLNSLDINVRINEEENTINFSLLSNLRKLSMTFETEFEDPEFCKDLGLFSNLLSLNIQIYQGSLNLSFVILFLF